MERERERERSDQRNKGEGEGIMERVCVCVTGGGGYVASWVVKLLLSKGYIVHATVRDPCDEKKNGHLNKLENAAENLHLFKTDLLDYEGLFAAIAGCTGVFHIASPVPSTRSVPNPKVELLEPSVTGTRNVLNACSKAKVKKVVVVSSTGAVMLNPSWPKDQDMDESCWTDIEHSKSIDNWYCAGKTKAEMEALEYAKRGEVNVVTVCPSIVIGPMLQSTLNASSLLLLSYMKGASDVMEDADRPVVDVRDLADAILLAYEKPQAEGRYICSSYVVQSSALVEMLKSMFPDYNYPNNFIKAEGSMKLSSQKLQNLGWKYRPLDETLADGVKNLEETGLLCKQ